MGLLKKLAHGFGAREADETMPAPVAAAHRQAPVQPQRPAQRPVQQAPQAQPVRPAAPQATHAPRVEENPFAPKRASLDRSGRIIPAEKASMDEDQLEIPAFLRRQSS